MVEAVQFVVGDTQIAQRRIVLAGQQVLEQSAIGVVYARQPVGIVGH